MVGCVIGVTDISSKMWRSCSRFGAWFFEYWINVFLGICIVGLELGSNYQMLE